MKFHKEIQIQKKHYHIYNSVGKCPTVSYEPPVFGITALGCSHGFDACDSTSGFIIWVNKKGVMIDPPPFSSNALE